MRKPKHLINQSKYPPSHINETLQRDHQQIEQIGKLKHCVDPNKNLPSHLETYRVFFSKGPTQKSSKYEIGPNQQDKMAKYTGPTQSYQRSKE